MPLAANERCPDLLERSRLAFFRAFFPLLLAAVAASEWAVVLSHRPDCFPQAAALGACLVLSGHTHGGQIGLPSLLGRRVRNLAEFITRFDRGLYRSGRATLYVNRGLGFTGQPIRLFTSREIAALALQRCG